MDELNYGIKQKGTFVECLLLFLGLGGVVLIMLLQKGVQLSKNYTNSVVPSIAVMMFYTVWLLTLFDLELYCDEARFIITLITVPTIIGAFVMLLFQSQQTRYHENIAVFVNLLHTKNKFSWDELDVLFPGTFGLSTNIMYPMLIDMKNNNLIDYANDGNWVEVFYINPVLKVDTSYATWSCVNCGGENVHTDGNITLQCEYCGNEKNEENGK